MSEIKLFNHNKETYENILNLWSNGTNKVGVVQATGTGKSYIISECCNYLRGSNILILAPKLHILNTLKDLVDLPDTNITYMTYTKLNLMNDEDMNNLSPDLIVLDEFHRCGSNAWGKSVNKLLGIYSDCKVLGTTATNIRFLDNYRDMAIEIFDNNLACKTDVIDAITSGILPMPLYVTSLYSVDEEISKIKNNLNRNDEDYTTITDKLDALKDWSASSGVPDILKKYIDGSINKFIVFCKNQSHLESVSKTVCEWFRKAGISENVIPYVATYKNGQKNNLETIEAFKNGDENSIHLLFSIDILNEGLHIDSTGVILLRETVSPTIFFQQIGRALSVSNSKKPLIFDFVNNFNSLKIMEFKNRLIAAREKLELDTENKEITAVDFTLYDESKHIRELLNDISNLIMDKWDSSFNELCKFFELNNHSVVPSDDEELSSLYKWCNKQRFLYSKDMLSQDRIDKLNSVNFPWDIKLERWMLKYNKLKDYYTEFNTTKVPASYDKEMYTWCHTQRLNKAKLSELQISLLNELNFKWKVLDEEFEERFNELLEYKEEHGDLLVPRRYHNKKFANWVYRIRNPKDKALLSQDRLDRLNEIGFVWNVDEYNWNTKFNELKKYYEETNNYLFIRNNKTLAEWANRQRQYYRENKLTDEKILLLQSINFIFDVQSIIKKNG